MPKPNQPHEVHGALREKLDSLFAAYHLNGIGQGGLTSSNAKIALLQLFEDSMLAVIGEPVEYNPETMHKRNWHAQENLKVQQMHRLAALLGKGDGDE